MAACSSPTGRRRRGEAPRPPLLAGREEQHPHARRPCGQKQRPQGDERQGGGGQQRRRQGKALKEGEGKAVGGGAGV